ncbi:MAG: prolipoprotein diacylglyceryl transferase [Defluviitoga tunisiensis]|jgi:phosphatidylglycerol:prolipoprotein diacylglycerol transferase|nr:prolipoprotein diacylglyceryl transferase [Defluviitoga tunisiensis]HOB55188.1 prolipoprotein diacylglyceryl transferase [Defluviitoga tunisiensis]HOL86678.1 prolipoprotein diacylglyceryl transferase [Defluviitoga tunisiensis]HPZ66490.1 prolipoprotein diacylglyceryl transferase [Defluviitoga tunisiensis]HQD43071.1 prolipoprotein diacylglyceryl transferase [Defluviitoga tunisiensis]
MKKDKTFLYVLWIALTAFFVISFIILPKSFSGEWYFDSVLIKIGFIEIRWYGLLIAVGILLATFIAENEAKREKVSEDDFFSVLALGIIFGIIGARIYYVIFNFSYFSHNLIDIFKTWEGGLAIHGAILAAFLVAFLYSHFKKNCTFTFLQGLDIFTFVLPLAQSIGRWGNFFNHEAYGRPTNLPWKMYIAPEHRVPGYQNFEFFHPTFLYESFWDLIVFLILFYFIRNKRQNYGEVTALYLILYSVGRIPIELLRTDSLYLGKFRVAVLISILLIIVGVLMFVFLRKGSIKKGKNNSIA